MRKVVVYELVSLDGVAQDPEDWIFDVDQEVDDDLLSAIAGQDDVLLGRRTYDEWANYWPTATSFPAFADFINRVPKHVITASSLQRPWANTVVVDQPVVQYVRALKAGDGGDIGVHGSIELVRSLLAADLVDEVRLTISPILVGVGRKLFDSADRHRRLILDSSRPTPNGHLLVRYHFARGSR